MRSLERQVTYKCDVSHMGICDTMISEHNMNVLYLRKVPMSSSLSGYIHFTTVMTTVAGTVAGTGCQDVPWARYDHLF